MIIRDYECQECGNVQEEYVYNGENSDTVRCRQCNSVARKILTMRNTAPVDAPWISSVLEVVDKKSDAPHCKEFLKHPTRSNMHKWMKHENLRPLEDNEPCLPPSRRTTEYKKQRKEKLMKRYKERTAVTLAS